MRYASAHRGGWAAIVAVTLLATAFELLAPWPMKLLIDNVLAGKPLPPWLAAMLEMMPAAGTAEGLVAWLALGGLVVFVLSSTLDFVLTYLWTRVGQSMVYQLAADLFARIQRRSLAFHSRNPVGDSLARITGDNWSVYTIVDSLLFAPLHAGITAIAMLVLMFQMNRELTYLSMAVAPLMACSALFVGQRLRSSAREQREIESQIQSHVQQTLRGIPVVQAFAQETREYERFRGYTVAAIVALRRNALITNFASLGSGLSATAGTGAVLYYGSQLILDGKLEVGSLLIFLAYLGSLQLQLKSFVTMYATLQTVGAKIDRVCEVLEAEPEITDRPGAVAPARLKGCIEFQDVTFGYEPRRPVLKGVSLTALPGETIAIVGSTGAGKSTLMSLIPRFFDPWAGRVLLDGHDARDIQLAALRQQVSLVLQEPFLFPITIAQNIAYGRPEATPAQIEQAARDANAHAFIMALPDGYETLVGERGATLSGGERQRLSIARALLRQAPILILDEPTSALDVASEHQIVEALERLMKERTTFVIAHRLSTIRRADKIVVLEHGQVREIGTHLELLERGDAYARFHAIQTAAPAPVRLEVDPVGIGG